MAPRLGRYRTHLGVAALAAAALLLESTLTRLLAVAQFYHFAFLVVSLALLGFGASGTLLSLVPRLGRTPPHVLLAWAGAGFAVSTGVAYLVVNLLPFDSYSIAWDPWQILFFACYYLALTLPFVFAGVGIGAALAAGTGGSHRIYAANLLGSALGALLAPGLMALAGVPGAVIGSALLALMPAAWSREGVHPSAGRTASTALSRAPAQDAGAVAGDMTSSELSRAPAQDAGAATRGAGSAARAGRSVARAALLAGLAALVALAALNQGGRGQLGLTLSSYKGLSYARRYPGAQWLLGQWDAVSRVDVLADAGTRLLPGLSYTYQGAPPRQLGVSLDGDSLLPVPLEGPADFAAADYLPEAVAFELRPAATVLVLEPAGGLGLLQALRGRAGDVTAVTDNPLLRRAIGRAAPVADLYGQVARTVIASPRVFLRQGGPAYGIIDLPLTDPYRPVASGAYSLAETYTLTTEAFAAALARLQPGGLLVVTRWLQMPPSEDLRLVATLAAALERIGSVAPADALVAYRGIQTLTALVNPAGWTSAELAAVRAFAAARRYDLVWAPDIRPDEVNVYNRLAEPAHYNAVRTLLAAGDRRTFYDAYPFAIAPATDDRPFFFHFFRWTQTPEVLATLGRTWQPFGGSGYLILFALLALVLVLSAGLILLPLLWHRRRLRSAPAPQAAPASQAAPAPQAAPASQATIFAYFGLLGLAFLCVEIPLIQRWLLAFGHPTYAFTAVVLMILLGSSLGSLLARSAAIVRLGPRAALLLLAAGVMVTGLAGGAWVELALGWPTALRALALALILLPLAVLMGLPFPLGLAWLERVAPDAVPWAWAVNGCASVVASVTAAIFALGYGFTAVLLIGGAAYALAAALLRRA